ncbi:hypothetical protein CRG98_021254 [Punica granatum]|uniref:Uncharacterized protein n=1 Tax=Punica granatum TaxID=22663 RepID=A0A2I0JQ02_PUNGR|nr:hypothetical protein CRG98_021254 [Punica granatum]
MHVGEHDETREPNLDRVKKIVPCPKKARGHSVTPLGGKPVISHAFPGSGCFSRLRSKCFLKIFWLKEGKFASCIEEEEAEIFWGKGRLPLGSPWVPRPKKKSRNEVRPVSGYAFPKRVLLGEQLTRDGGSRSGVITSPKSSEDLWGPVRWQSRLDPFLYSESLSNLTSYFVACGISSVQANEIEPEPTKYVPSGVTKLYGPECGLLYEPACAILDHAAWKRPPPQGCVTDTREKDSPLIIL